MNIEKLAAHGAQGVAVGAIVAWIGLVWFLKPVSTGGIDDVTWFAVSVAAFVPFALVAAVHAWLGAQLKRGAESIRG